MTIIDTGPTRDAATRSAPTSTGSRNTKVLGAITLALVGVAALYGLVISPPDANQGNAARLLYIHVPSATLCYVAFAVTAIGSVMSLWKRTEFWDLLAASSAEIGVVFASLCLITGMLWGRPIWGVYWTWDARLTTMALLLVLFVGYLALRRVLIGSPNRARWSAVAGIVAAIDIPIVHYSTTWWVTLHQQQTIRLIGKSEIGGSMLFSLLISMFAFAFVYWWLMIHRFRVHFLEERLDEIGLETALTARRAEADEVGQSTSEVH